MALFETTLILLLIAIALLQSSRRLAIPYPTMLAMAGVAVAALPWTPAIGIDPHLSMALFIAPALLDAAFDFPPLALRRHWIPLVALAALAVVFTTLVVAWAGVVWGGMPLAAAIALGAIVSPPDAAAATAMLRRFSLPRSTVTVLLGESLLNDAIALLIYGAAVGRTAGDAQPHELVLQLALAAPGGVLLGIVLARISSSLSRHMFGTMGHIVFGFVVTWTVWIIADRLHLSPILAVVAFGMTIARRVPSVTPARDRVNAYAVWEVAVFVLNVLAFLLVGLQARTIVGGLDRQQLQHALAFAGVVFALVVFVRVGWVMVYNLLMRPVYRRMKRSPPTRAQGTVVAWCGMRGLVTLATALALPDQFPARGLIVLSALGVVLGTLVLQGLTLGPLIRRLNFPPDDSFDTELTQARLAMLDAAVEALDGSTTDTAQAMRKTYAEKRGRVAAGSYPADDETLGLRRQVIAAQRSKIDALRLQGTIDDDVFHALEEELDRAELAVSPQERLELLES
ncbi:MAG TPA: cation:proton antiporter [Rudaea sp.]